jgi:HSP20 family molecular chaperone IbpA
MNNKDILKMLNRFKEKAEEAEDMLTELSDESSGDDPFDMFKNTQEEEDSSIQFMDSENKVEVVVEVPGFESDMITVQRRDGTIRVEANATEEMHVDSKTYTVELPEDADEDTLSAEYNNGLLKLSMDRVTTEEEEEDNSTGITIS